jgi:hypothetical protein
MYENVPFFEHICIQKLPKKLIWTTNYFHANFYGVSKNAEFYADSKSLKRAQNNCQKKVTGKKQRKKVQNPNKHKICIVFSFNFFPEHFLSPFQRIPNQHKILRFWHPYLQWLLRKKKIRGHKSTVCKFWRHMLKKWYIFRHFEKRKNLLSF